MPPKQPSATASDNTPLAPSVEKAYYRKCIQLKRRLNEVEAANDEARIRRVRLDRSILKMRLERAFLLDELRKRMDYNVDASEGSGEEGMATPPPDRPHRDKRRRQQPAPSTGPSTSTFQATAYTPSGQRTSEPGAGATTPMAPAGHQNAHEDARYGHVDPSQQLPSQPAALPHGSPYGPPPTGVPSGPPPGAMNGGSYEDRDERPISRQAGAAGEPVGAGPTIVEENGERKIASSSAESANADSQRGGFAAVNQ
ncbi:hypothetical protein M409DRAFT_67780 [Zasmidium cellare ATCC 36951]|uniref:INO80 complex subunit F domain-containing protein n=1 Tax=Zasmidium cellare ATCC 36951 TaxID=1080233 RepID=A0A6A6CGX1_ZASCE|nr:uncharacterized protein M409DRAFT_67780 [Zasmidium cellare ATCC 36951]KAF2164666.1 hypothetical protein M409DRAFT_67780 [Zasmidium cellare ATCC 36951]